MSSKHILALVIGLSLSTAANADEYRQHGAHVHGHVEFNIAQDGKDLLVEITAPGADVVGFEHAPENEQQEQALKQAIATLEDSNTLFAINAQANCDIEEAYVNHNLSTPHEDHDHSEHGHDDHANHNHEGTNTMITTMNIMMNMSTMTVTMLTMRSMKMADMVSFRCNIASAVTKLTNSVTFKPTGLINFQRQSQSTSIYSLTPCNQPSN